MRPWDGTHKKYKSFAISQLFILSGRCNCFCQSPKKDLFSIRSYIGALGARLEPNMQSRRSISYVMNNTHRLGGACTIADNPLVQRQATATNNNPFAADVGVAPLPAATPHHIRIIVHPINCTIMQEMYLHEIISITISLNQALRSAPPTTTGHIALHRVACLSAVQVAHSPHLRQLLASLGSD